MFRTEVKECIGKRLSPALDAGKRIRVPGKRVTTGGKRVTVAGKRLRAVGKRVTVAGKRLRAVGKRVTAAGKRVTTVGKRVSSNYPWEIVNSSQEITLKQHLRLNFYRLPTKSYRIYHKNKNR
jgi:hypothetical protein